MKYLAAVALLPACLLGASPQAHAQQAFGTEIFASDDADDTSILKTGLFYDFRHLDSEHYRGIKVEEARFRPFGGDTMREQRLYYRFADTGDRWKWNGALGTDGDTWLGSASIHTEEARRQEYFVEREILETPLGLDRGLYYTFLGAAYDLPLDERNILTGLVGVQDFSGDNTRLHLRGRYIRVLKEDWGLSAQLRTRYFHSTEPGEFDYYSPRWYAEAIPTLQLRRFRGGWQYQAAAGWGRQRDSESGWRSARLLEAAITSPKTRDWFFRARVGYSNTPINTGYTYDYTQFALEAFRRF